MRLRSGDFAKHAIHPGTIYKGKLLLENFMKGKAKSLTGGAVGGAIGGAIGGPPGAAAGALAGGLAPRLLGLLRPSGATQVSKDLLEKAIVRT